MPTDPDPNARTISYGFRLRESEAQLIDTVRGELKRGPWMRAAALSVARSKDTPPEVSPRYRQDRTNRRTIHVRPWFSPIEARVIQEACGRRVTEQKKCSNADYVRDAALWLADFQVNPDNYVQTSL